MRKTQITLVVVTFAAACLFGSTTCGAGAVGRVTHLSGILTAKGAEGSARLLSVSSDVLEGETLTTEQETYARVKFSDGGEVVLRPGSRLNVAVYAYTQDKPQEDSIVLNMLKGGIRAVTGLVGKRNSEAVGLKTETATIGIRGTHFGALMCQNDCAGVPTVTGRPPQNGLHLDVADGAIIVRNSGGQQVLTAGQFGFVPSATAPPVIVPPQQGVPVTMPTNISQNRSDGRGVGRAREGECVVQ